MSSSSLPLSSSSDATLEPGLDPKKAVRPGHVASLAGQSRSNRLEREPFGLAFPCLPSVRTAIHLPCAAVPASASHLHIASKLPPASSTSAPTRRRVIWRSFAYLLVSTPQISRTHTWTQLDDPFVLWTWHIHLVDCTHRTDLASVLSESTHTRQSQVSALSHSSFTY
ncbi:hypothetical protein B0H14DRAFT_2703804, partial [Mycena olivaceomarginata]